MKKKIFLTGFRGAGKTTLGKILAKKLNYEFVEMDELIVKKAKKSIAKITQDGKDWFKFRLLEHNVLKEIIKKEKIVVATGGGLFVNDVKFSKNLTFGEKNFNLVKKLPEKIIIFLKVKKEILKERLKKENEKYNKEWRPPLTGKKSSLEKEMEIYSQRLPLYEKRADFILEISNQTPKEILKKILSILKSN